jgi:multicomponent Na+:H+ antiporter subunit D
MVELGVYAVARLLWEVFAGPLAPHHVALRAVLIAFGVLTSLVGAGMCVVQRHVKRLLAFSTISHVGMFICGIGLLTPHALAGVFTYAIGHGFTKGGLFMVAGLLLHRFATIDEYDLHGRGREVPFAGVLLGVGALLLAATPVTTLYFGKSLLEEAAGEAGYGWLIAVFITCSAMTAGALLRVTGRVFLGWGPRQAPDPGQARAAEEAVDEQRSARDHTPPMMLVVPAVLFVAAAVAGLVPGLVPGIERQAVRFVDHSAYHAWVIAGTSVSWPAPPARHLAASSVLYGALSLLGALGVAGLGLWARELRERLPAPVAGTVAGLRRLQSGDIRDYIAWWTAGTAALGGLCLIALR